MVLPGKHLERTQTDYIVLDREMQTAVNIAASSSGLDSHSDLFEVMVAKSRT